MITKTEKSEIVKKTEELCETILAQPVYKDLKQKVETFIANDEATSQYNSFLDLHRRMQQKEREGADFSEEEIAEYNEREYKLYTNDTIREFLYAERELEKIHNMISAYVIKTIELDRLPDEDELELQRGCGCGGSCGCGGH
ncbi:MAG TPA: YlbF family regulator [Bacilli bacterium]